MKNKTNKKKKKISNLYKFQYFNLNIQDID